MLAQQQRDAAVVAYMSGGDEKHPMEGSPWLPSELEVDDLRNLYVDFLEYAGGRPKRKHVYDPNGTMAVLCVPGVCLFLGDGVMGAGLAFMLSPGVQVTDRPEGSSAGVYATVCPPVAANTGPCGSVSVGSTNGVDWDDGYGNVGAVVVLGGILVAPAPRYDPDWIDRRYTRMAAELMTEHLVGALWGLGP